MSTCTAGHGADGDGWYYLALCGARDGAIGPLATTPRAEYLGADAWDDGRGDRPCAACAELLFESRDERVAATWRRVDAATWEREDGSRVWVATKAGTWAASVRGKEFRRGGATRPLKTFATRDAAMDAVDDHAPVRAAVSSDVTDG